MTSKNRLMLMVQAYENWTSRIGHHWDQAITSNAASGKPCDRDTPAGDQEVIDRMKRGAQLVSEDAEHAASVPARDASDGHTGASGSSWSTDRNGQLQWRPFQLAFQLLCVPAFSEEDHELDRKAQSWTSLVPDRRRQDRGLPGPRSHSCFSWGASETRRPPNDVGLDALHPTHAHEPAVRACRAPHHGAEELRADEPDLGDQSFLIGLWVGQSGSPNKVQDSREDNNQKAQVLNACPSCGKDLDWDPEWVAAGSPSPETATHLRWYVACGDHGELPVHVIDETLYQQPPDLVLGTVDKFAQIVRRATRTRSFRAWSW